MIRPTLKWIVLLFPIYQPPIAYISQDGRLKVADFGLARAFCPPVRPLTHEVITLWYAAAAADT